MNTSKTRQSVIIISSFFTYKGLNQYGSHLSHLYILCNSEPTEFSTYLLNSFMQIK